MGAVSWQKQITLAFRRVFLHLYFSGQGLRNRDSTGSVDGFRGMFNGNLMQSRTLCGAPTNSDDSESLSEAGCLFLHPY